MTDDDEELSLEDFFADVDEDYRETKRWEMEKLATKKRADASINVQHPIREDVSEEGEDEQIVETMGLSVSPPTNSGVISIQNTSADSQLAERFVAFDVELVDGIIEGLEEMKRRYNESDEFVCPCCAGEFDYPEELAQDEYGYICPSCGYLV